MVKLEVVRAHNAALVKSQPLIAVFPGGTSGIGDYAIRALANTHSKEGKGLRLYIAGRNQGAAEKTIAECQAVCPSGQFRFVKAKDLSLLEDVDRVCDEIMKAEEREVNQTGGKARIDMLVMTQGVVQFSDRIGEFFDPFDPRFALTINAVVCVSFTLN